MTDKYDWYAEENHFGDWLIYDVATDDTMAEVLSDDPKTAANIVKAVNAHDDLVAALRDAIDSMEYINANHQEARGYGIRCDRIDKAKSALTKAGAL